MSRDDAVRPLPSSLASPQVSLLGHVDEAMVQKFLDQLREAEKGEGDIAIEITTQGGDPEMARRMILEVDGVREKGRRIVFLGKTEVYSAGATLMAGFPREDRFLTRDAVLLIHCRQLDKTVELSGPIRASMPKIKALQEQLEQGVKLETQNFERLVAGSDVSMDELIEKALYNWYVPAELALERKLVAAIVDPADAA